MLCLVYSVTRLNVRLDLWSVVVRSLLKSGCKVCTLNCAGVCTSRVKIFVERLKIASEENDTMGGGRERMSYAHDV